MSAYLPEGGRPYEADSDGRPPRNEAPRHRPVNRRDWVWLPVSGHGHLAPHPWCRDCGQVQVVGTLRAMNMGGLVNVIGWLERELADRGVRVTEAQKRLIVRKLAAVGADDTFALSRSAQNRIVSQVVGDYLSLPPDVVHRYMCSC